MPVLGPSRADRSLTYRAITNSIAPNEDVILEAFTTERFIDSLTTNVDVAFGQYGLAWELAVTTSLNIEFPLRDLVDETGLAHDVFRLIWEMRFLMQEQPDGAAALEWLGTFQRWSRAEPLTAEDFGRLDDADVRSRPSTFEERVTILLLLLSLANQNGVFDHMLVILDAVDDPSCPLEEILAVLRAFDAWALHASVPVGFLAGFDLEKLPSIRRANQQFAGVVLS